MRFGILSDEMIRRMSVTPEGVDKENILDGNGEPQRNGILDRRMGTTDRDTLCQTCEGDYINCPGHFGHINLTQGVFHGGYVTTVLNVLRCICHNCGHVKLRNPVVRSKLVNEKGEMKVKSGRTRFKMIKDECAKLKICEASDELGFGCGAVQASYTKTGLSII
jgi:DNA-directed RNA polymerase II subunit RPB1